MADENPAATMDSIKWFHSIPLNDGTVTPGLDASMAKLEQIGLPKDLTGKTVLDIGSWDGFFSFQAEKAGAKASLQLTTSVGVAQGGVRKMVSISLTRH